MIKTLLASASKGSGLLLALGFVGCALDQPVEYGTTAGMSFEEFQAMTLRDDAGDYIVDWDRVIRSDAELREFWGNLQQGALSIYNNGADIKWNDTQKKNLTFCVSNGFAGNKAAVVAAFEAATTNGWEKFADVNFVYLAGEDANCTAANPNVVFDVNQSTGQGFLARAFFPNDARGNRNVIIDTSSFDPNQTGGISLANIIGHELGHTLGFRHEHIRPEANAGQCAEDNQFRGLTTYDSASVMHYPQCNGTSATLAFTARDQEGVRLVYGAPLNNTAPMTQITFPQNGATVPPSFEVQASIVDTDLTKAELFIDGSVSGAPITTAPFTFQVTNLATGLHELKIVGTDGAGQTAEVVIQVTVQPNGGGGGGGGGGSGSGDGDGDGAGEDISGGCSAGGSGAGMLFALGFIGLVIRRRRR